MRIRKKFQIAFILTSIIFIAGIITIFYFTLMNDFEEVEGNRLNQRVENSAKAIDNFMLTRIADFNVLSNNPLFSSSSSEITSEYLTRVENQYPFYNKLLFVNKEGIILSSSDKKFIGENLLQLEPDLEDEFKKTINGGNDDVFVSNLSITSKDEIKKNQSFNLKLFSDVIDLEGNVVGVLVGFMNMKPLNELILYIDNISTGYKRTYLLNNEGVVLVSGNKEVKIYQKHPDFLINELQQKFEKAEKGFYFNENSKGIKFLSGFTTLSKYGTESVNNWYLLRIVPFNEIMKPFYKTVYIVVFIILFIISLFIIFLIYSNTKRVKNSLLAAESREYSLKEVSKVAKIGYQEYDIATNTFIWSDYVYEIFGLDPKDGMPSPEEIVSVFDKESQKKIAEADQNIDYNGIHCDIELKLINKREQEVWVRYVAQPVVNQKNKIVGRRGVLQDITVSKNAQLELQHSKQQIQDSLDLLEKSEFAKDEASKVGKIGYWNYDAATGDTVWSDYVYEIFGLKPQKIAPVITETAKFFNKEYQIKIAQVTSDLATKGIPYDIELKFINKDNKEVWIRTKGQPIYNEQNEIIGRGGITQDITESKIAQLELELSKQKIQATLELLEKSEFAKSEGNKMAKIGYLEHDLATNVFVWSDIVYQFFGLEPSDEIPSRDEIMKLYDKESQEKLAQANLKLITKGISYDVDLRIINFKKEEVWVRNAVQAVYNQDNKIVGRRGVMQDITASKKVQLELQFSKQKIQESLKLLEKSEYSKNEGSKIAKIGYWDHDLITNTIIWSDYLYQIFESNPKNGIPPQNEIMEKFDKESQEKLAQATLDIISKGISYDIELKFINKQNEEVWLRNVAQPIYNKENEIVGKRGVMQNITASKKAQLELELSKQKIQISLDQLEESEYSLKETSKIAKIGFWEYDLSTKVFIWSDYIYHIYAIDPKDEIPSRKELIAFYDLESQKKIQQSIQDISIKGISYDIELKLINLKKKEIWVRTVVQPIYDKENNIIGRRGVMQDITASKKVQQELELSKQEIQESLNLLEQSKYSMDEASKVAKIGYFEQDIATDTFKWSDYLFNIHGFDPVKKIPSKEEFFKNIDKESLEILNEATSNLYAKGVSYDIEMKIFNQIKNKNVWVRSVAQPIYNEKNEIIGRRGVTQDITASKKAQQELELSKQEIQESLNLLEQSKYSMDEASKVAKIGYHDYDIATDTFIWSEYLYYIFGIDPKETITRNKAITYFDEASKEKVIQATLDLDSTGTPYDLELKIINGRNEEVWVRNVAEPIFNEQNEVIGRRGVSQDITIAKKAQLELEVSKQEIETALELLEKSEYSKNEASKVAKIGFMEYDNATDVFKWSEYLYNLYGLDPTKKVPPIKEIIPYFDEESKQKMKVATTALERDGVPYDLELKLFNQKKKTVWMRLVVQPVYNEQQEVVGRRGVAQDITQRKLIQNELDRQNKRLFELNNSLNLAQKLSHVGSWQWDMVTDTAEWSDEMYNIYGVSKENFCPTNENVKKTVLPEDLYKLEQGVSSLLINKTFVPFDFRIQRPSGEVRTVFIMALEKADNEKVFGVTKDITERVQIEKENLRIKNNFRRLFDNATISIWNEDLSQVFKEIEVLRRLDIPNIKLYLEAHPDITNSLLDKIKINSVNRATLKLFKAKSHQEFLNNFRDTLGIGSKKVFIRFIEAIWNNEKAFTSEVTYKTLAGDEFATLLSVGIPKTLTEQQTVPVSVQSIQSIKDAQLEKKESIRRLKEAQELAHVGSWLFNISSKKTEWSDETFRIWGYDLDKSVPSHAEIINRIHIDDQEMFKNSGDLASTIGEPYDIEFRIYIPNQEQKILRSICQPIFDENGKVVTLRGTNQDITAQKLAMQEIEKAEEMYRILTDNSNDLISLQEKDSTFKYVSPSVKTLLGYEPSSFIGKKVFNLVHKQDVEKLKEDIQNRLSTDKYNEALTFRVRHKEGHYIWLEYLSSPVYEGKEISHFVTTSRDITMWVKAKKEIEEYQKSLQKMTTEITMIEEKQKKEIASNIHDHLSQSLVISKMRINQLKKNPQLQVIDDDLKFIETHISEALENSRKITYELSPPVLYQLGIIDALNWLLDDVEATHKITCQFNSNVNNVKLDDVKSILLFRSIQEVIKNTIKYANASLITLNFDRNDFGIYILIYDDGIGFNTDKLKNINNHSGSGFGLFTVQERIQNIKGKFSIESQKNVGTFVKIFIPLAT
ncbi:PAS domain S-box-containing protein [Polaribacter sp. KT25b]|uniref:PAS domain-containing protein n=1 Tax=Polaribacter sp. KT25b TaxID=1855336 RepID=UPI00087DC66D|nr:PAS domain-containing protein [Polaribacter sp. KT25b]SDS48297.1 PAS domain S-box-containing protein [Polaribacter sp. KT25b]